MNERAVLRKKIWELDFAIYELVLFLDTHPTSKRALELMRQFKRLREDTVSAYESRYGKYVVTAKDVEPTGRWKWIDGPWPWENDFTEE